METPQTFSDKVIAITGAGSGIGRATAIYLAQRGATLAISDVNESSVKAVATEILAELPNAQVTATAVDISSAEQVKSWISEAVAAYGRLDSAANIAGVSGHKEFTPLAEQSDESWKFVLDVNLSGTMYCLREELRVLSEGGSIVNTSSVLGMRASHTPGGAHYVSSKHGINGLTKSAAREYGHKGIRVNCVNP